MRDTLTLPAALLSAVACLAMSTMALGSQRPPQARPESPAAVAIAAVPVAAWSSTAPNGSARIAAAAPANAAAEWVSPGGRGNDGAPALTALGADSVVLVASRANATGSYLWSRQWTPEGWQAARRLPRTHRLMHHPALAGNADSVWAVWVSGDVYGRGESARLMASRWSGAEWTMPLMLPAAPGQPMAPSIAVDRRGTPIVVWAASDGSDAEIWASRFKGGTWTGPERITDNDVPDIVPQVAAGPGRALVAWSHFDRDGYVPHVARARGRNWTRPRALTNRTGNAPVVLPTKRPTVLWTLPPDTGGGSAVVGSRLVAGRWQSLPRIGTALNARLSGTAGNGQVTTAWHERAGLRVAAASDTPGQGWRMRDLRRPVGSAAEAIEVTLPGAYVAFGDSITQGVLGAAEEDGGDDDTPLPLAEPYTTFLAGLMAELVGEEVPVRNDGLAGEVTAEAVNRISTSLASGPDFTLILHAANDVSVLIDSDTILNNLTSMVLQTRNADSVPLLSSITPRPENGGFQGGINERTVELNVEIERIAGEEGAIFVDQHAAFMFRPDLYSDNIHPTQVGYVHMAEVWFAALKPILNDWLDDRDTGDDDARDDALGGGTERQEHRRS
jgi:lysophospholipase L1-like esterase